MFGKKDKMRVLSLINTSFFIFVLFLFSCESDENKISEAKSTVNNFIADLNFENFDNIESNYPGFRGLKNYYKLFEFKILTASIDKDKIVVTGKSKFIEALFVLEKIDGAYKITKSKGLSIYTNTDLLRYCKKIGCLSKEDYDIQIHEVCSNKKDEFNNAIRVVKNDIESKVIAFNGTLISEVFYLSGDLTYKNFSPFDIPPYSYNIFLEYLNSKGEVLFTEKQPYQFEPIRANQTGTIHIFKTNSEGFKRVRLKLDITNTKFLEKGLADVITGSNCVSDLIKVK